MAALGCFLLLVLPLAPLVLGGWLAGPQAMVWGAGVDLAIAIGVTGAMGQGLVKAGLR
jgi:hypothetical protein